IDRSEDPADFGLGGGTGHGCFLQEATCANKSEGMAEETQANVGSREGKAAERGRLLERTEQDWAASSVTTVEDEVNRLEQALLDLKCADATSVALTQCPSEARERELGRSLARAAHGRGFVTAHLSLAEAPLDTFQDLVSWLLDALVPPGEARVTGLLHLLDRYYERYGARSRVLFQRGVEEFSALGDLAAFCQAYLDADDDARREVRSLTLW